MTSAKAWLACFCNFNFEKLPFIHLPKESILLTGLQKSWDVLQFWADSGILNPESGSCSPIAYVITFQPSQEMPKIVSGGKYCPFSCSSSNIQYPLINKSKIFLQFFHGSHFLHVFQKVERLAEAGVTRPGSDLSDLPAPKVYIKGPHTRNTLKVLSVDYLVYFVWV